MGQWVRRILHDDEDVLIVGGDEDLVLPTLDPQVGQLVGGVEVADDGLGAFGQRGDEHGVLKRKLNEKLR